MLDLEKNCRVAVVQCSPVMFDKDATLAKCIDLIKQAGAGGAQLIVLPELIIPCYPYGMTFGFTVGSRQEEGRADWKRYYDGSIVVPGAETDALGEAARFITVILSLLLMAALLLCTASLSLQVRSALFGVMRIRLIFLWLLRRGDRLVI